MPGKLQPPHTPASLVSEGSSESSVASLASPITAIGLGSPSLLYLVIAAVGKGPTIRGYP
ncbi:MAG: hypothetical protein F7B95_03835 [Desulfurococcales archaeon]|nr:hypothetical protein [Desulfurococcales archaeon]